MPRGERSELRGVEEGVSERDTRVSELRARLKPKACRLACAGAIPAFRDRTAACASAQTIARAADRARHRQGRRLRCRRAGHAMRCAFMTRLTASLCSSFSASCDRLCPPIISPSLTGHHPPPPPPSTTYHPQHPLAPTSTHSTHQHPPPTSTHHPPPTAHHPPPAA